MTLTVTFLFSDIELSTDLLRRVGDGAFARVRGDHRRLMREAFEAHGGRAVDTAGDSFFVAFGSARDAVKAAVAAQHALAKHAWPADVEVRVRMGLHTTEPHATADGFVGLGVHRASRICDAAHGGQIFVSGATAGIVEDAELPGVELLDLGEHKLKGLPRPQQLYQLTAPGLPAAFPPPRTAAFAGGVATFLLTDLSRWHQVIGRLGDEASGAVLVDYYAIISKAVEASGGFTLELVGDSGLAAFSHAGNAILAAIAVRAAIAERPWAAEHEVGVRITVHSGRWSGARRPPTAHTALLRLDRLAQVTEPGQVLVSPTTAALLEGDRSVPPLRDLGERAIPGLDGLFRVYEVAEPL
ncbi:MAG TPA: adenylate/guanylate cyclase domain-containing protein [Candidatus Limnocylindrales bacterium]|nr:adenylate/guanylate cyclase domain-containing protein [Candidatus Limnocylindrales bacterium]